MDGSSSSQAGRDVDKDQPPPRLAVTHALPLGPLGPPWIPMKPSCVQLATTGVAVLAAR